MRKIIIIVTIFLFAGISFGQGQTTFSHVNYYDTKTMIKTKTTPDKGVIQYDMNGITIRLDGVNRVLRYEFGVSRPGMEAYTKLVEKRWYEILGTRNFQNKFSNTYGYSIIIITAGSVFINDDSNITVTLEFVFDDFGSRSAEETESHSEFKEKDIKIMVDEYIQKNMGSSISEATSLYDDNNIDFNSFGIVDKDFITEDKRNYFLKWPRRKITLTSAIDVKSGNSANTWVTSFNYHFSISNNKKTIQGNVWCELIFKETNNSLVIIREKGKILK